jgi:phosphoserine phosphatase
MISVLSLIGVGTKASLTTTFVETARRALEAAAMNTGAPDWLAPEEACDIPFEGDSARGLLAARAALAGRQIDVNVVDYELRRKKLLVADMDSTLIEQECLDELAAELGFGTEVAAITERAMRGELPFEPALRERVALLEGYPASIVEKVLLERISIMPGAQALVFRCAHCPRLGRLHPIHKANRRPHRL